MKCAWFLMEAANESFLPQRPNLASSCHSPPPHLSLCPRAGSGWEGWQRNALPVPGGRTLEAWLQPCSARTGGQPATALPRPMALGPGEMLGSDALLTADTRYLDAFKAETRSGIKPHLPLQPGLCSRQPWEGLGENESWTGRAAITPTRAPALVPEAACLLNTSFRVSAGLSCVYMQKAPHPAQDGVASLGISLPLHP